MTNLSHHNRRKVFLLASASCLATILCLSFSTSYQTALAAQESTQPISSRLAFLRAQRAAASARLFQQQPPKNETTAPASSTTSTSTTTTSTTSTTTTTTTTTPRPATTSSNQILVSSISANRNAALKPATSRAVSSANNQAAQQLAAASANNRSTRTADVFQNGDGFNIFVTNTCERESMHVNIKTSRPFYGVIHTRNQRQKVSCTVEGNGETEYNLDISHVLNQQDPAYCGAIRARKESPEDKDLLSVVLAVRVHRNIELSDDKFFLLNCTNRCRRPDCSPGPVRLTDGRDGGPNARVINDELAEREGGERETVTMGNGDRRVGDKKDDQDECTVWKFPWLITLLWCMGILLLAMIISHCIMCSSLVCRCVKTEVEEREQSVYEGATDQEDEDSLYNKKTHPMRIDYDNRDIYKTSNNYEPYRLDDDEECRDIDRERENKSNRRRNRR